MQSKAMQNNAKQRKATKVSKVAVINKSNYLIIGVVPASWNEGLCLSLSIYIYIYIYVPRCTYNYTYIYIYICTCVYFEAEGPGALRQMALFLRRIHLYQTRFWKHVPCVPYRSLLVKSSQMREHN